MWGWERMKMNSMLFLGLLLYLFSILFFIFVLFIFCLFLFFYFPEGQMTPYTYTRQTNKMGFCIYFLFYFFRFGQFFSYFCYIFLMFQIFSRLTTLAYISNYEYKSNKMRKKQSPHGGEKNTQGGRLKHFADMSRFLRRGGIKQNDTKEEKTQENDEKRKHFA